MFPNHLKYPPSPQPHFMTATQHLTSLPNSAGSSKKKAKSDIMQKVGLVQDGIGSLQSSSLSCHEGKPQWFLTKLDAKMALIHQHQQEEGDTEICLRKVDIWVHKAHGNVLDKEAETLWLKIQFQQMMQAAKDLGSDV
ncbi:hypothetical protein BDR04DRAFT_1115703 [Suillus decipiens]|nr:hypothetical protein BDR04DRAFT_1115703 [Suillus decipiens]